jgi:hypothetical protein
MLLEVPGWRRIRRFRLVRVVASALRRERRVFGLRNAIGA